MSRTLISLSPDLKRLDDDGYEIEVRGGYVFVKHVPYVAEDCNIRYGILISTLSLAGDVTTKPDSHTVWFVGGIPCDQNGNSLEDSLVAGHRQELDNGLVADYLFSSRLRKKGKALSRSVWSLNCLGGIRHVIGQFE